MEGEQRDPEKDSGRQKNGDYIWDRMDSDVHTQTG